MPRRTKHKPEEIVAKLRQVEVDPAWQRNPGRVVRRALRQLAHKVPLRRRLFLFSFALPPVVVGCYRQ